MAESPHMQTVQVAYPHIVKKDDEPARLFCAGKNQTLLPV